MESVGVHRLKLYGAPFDDTPGMIRLAQHGLLFRRMYAPQGSTSEAMAALFSSLYPYLDWYLISSLFPNLAIPSLPGVLADHGYRTAFIHSGQLEFGSQGQFLASRGFGKIIADDKDYDSPHDQELLPRTINWIIAGPSRPFFVAIWTQDTHHPYLAASHHDYGVGNDYLNRYLNAVHDTDALVGHLYSALKQMDLADDTLLIITGDHGEAFGEHGRTLHFSSVYDVELHIPLLIINERRSRVNRPSTAWVHRSTSPRPCLICWGCLHRRSGRATVCLTRTVPTAFTFSHRLVLRSGWSMEASNTSTSSTWIAPSFTI